jgi:PTH1 family peptidyl-tRNA hydrolase
MKIVIGLGNPGAEYVGTRHNVGFDVVDEFAVRLGWVAKPDDFTRTGKHRFDALTLDGQMQRTDGGSERLLLVKPITFMNLSGKSVQAAMAFHKTEVSDLLIILDDVYLPCGKLRLRAEGSSGGHNGLKDIERVLGGNKYPRLRVGVGIGNGTVPANIPQKDFVLGRFGKDEQPQIRAGVARACGAVATWADKGLTAAMQQFNGDDGVTNN